MLLGREEKSTASEQQEKKSPAARETTLIYFIEYSQVDCNKTLRD